MIAPHTLANFESLPKFIELIINYFYLYCRSKFLFALTKQNFSDSLFAYNFRRLNRKALLITLTELKLIANAPNIGDRRMPKNG